MDFLIDAAGRISINIDQPIRDRMELKYTQHGDLLCRLRALEVLHFEDGAFEVLRKEPSASALLYLAQNSSSKSNAADYVSDLMVRSNAAQIASLEVRQSEIYLPLLEQGRSFGPVSLSTNQVAKFADMLRRLEGWMGHEWADFVSPIRAVTIVEVPGYPDLPYFSGSSSEIWGAVHTCWPSDEAVLVEMLTHEAGHHWIHLFEELGALADDCWEGDNWPSPWRNELRPLGGVIHGTFVFAAAAAALCFLIRERSIAELIDVRSAATRAAYLAAQVEYGRDLCVKSGLLLKNGTLVTEAATRSLESVMSHLPGELYTNARRMVRERMADKFASWRQQGLIPYAS